MATMKWVPLVSVAFLVTFLSASLAGARGQPKPEVDARIQILWPHSGADVVSADRANITVLLFERGTLNAFCDGSGLMLMAARNNEVVAYFPAAGVAERRRVVKGRISFFAWDFNDVDVTFARDPANRLYFTVREFLIHGRDVPVDPIVRSNVWAHAADARTFFPTQEVPNGTYPAPSPGVVRLAPKIQIVWPHGGLPVSQADRVNITATIFHREALASMSVPPEHGWPVELYGALNQEPLRPIALGEKRLVTTNGVTYPVWDFNNIDVSAAKDARNKYFFQVKTSGSEGSNIWVHGADGRTYFPTPDVPSEGCP